MLAHQREEAGPLLALERSGIEHFQNLRELF
jgi:hypothetical protein